jgi:hypothetical protein
MGGIRDSDERNQGTAVRGIRDDNERNQGRREEGISCKLEDYGADDGFVNGIVSLQGLVLGLFNSSHFVGSNLLLRP